MKPELILIILATIALILCVVSVVQGVLDDDFFTDEDTDYIKEGTLTEYIESLPTVSRKKIPKKESKEYSFGKNFIIRMANSSEEEIARRDEFKRKQFETLSKYGTSKRDSGKNIAD